MTRTAPTLSLMERIIFLKEVHLFENLTGDQLLAISRISRQEVAKGGDVIFTEGSGESGLYVVISGKVEISRNINGQKRVITVLGQNENFGEISLFEDIPHSTDAIAREKTEYLVINAEPFIDLIHEEPSVGIQIVKILCKRIRLANTKL